MKFKPEPSALGCRVNQQYPFFGSQIPFPGRGCVLIADGEAPPTHIAKGESSAILAAYLGGAGKPVTVCASGCYATGFVVEVLS